MAATLDQVKQHLRVEGPFEDDMITVYLDAAKDYVASIGVDLDADPLPPSITAAVLLLVGSFYENREAASDRAMFKVPFSVDALLAPYRDVIG